jgi:SRSO17 transposase
LLIRQELDGSDTKFSFSNAKDSTPIETLTEWQSRRYFVERSLQDAKGLAGLDEYQVTGWRGWHHHTAMVLLAMLFLLRLKRKLAPSQGSNAHLKRFGRDFEDRHAKKEAFL